jgi:hypothetical protein
MYEVSSLSDFQKADLIVTRQWLRTVIWEIAIKNLKLPSSSLLDPKPSDSNILSLAFPLRLSSDLRQFLQAMQDSVERIGVHGSGILHKLFEITFSISNVIIHIPNAEREDTASRVDDILFLKRFMASFPRIDEIHRDILKKKFQRIQEMYPRVEQVSELLSPTASESSAVTTWSASSSSFEGTMRSESSMKRERSSSSMMAVSALLDQ